jgi:hypothetical protein
MIDILTDLTGLGCNFGADILSKCEFVH